MTKQEKPRYFERPEEDEEPLGFWHILGIAFASFLGVRSGAQREEDFRRANGLHMLIAGLLFTALIVFIFVAIAFYVS